MTETLSHVAMRRLNGPEASEYYEPFPSVRLSLSPDQTLVIDAPLVCDGPLVTNDVVDLQPDGRFRVIGRKDNIINSGGVKIQIETVEAKLRPFLTAPFAITALPDPKFGEAIVLLTTAAATAFPPEALDRYERPKQILRVEAIPMTGSGKIDRAACRRLAIETNECQTSKSKR